MVCLSCLSSGNQNSLEPEIDAEIRLRRGALPGTVNLP